MDSPVIVRDDNSKVEEYCDEQKCTLFSIASMIMARHFHGNVARVHHPWGIHCVMPFKLCNSVRRYPLVALHLDQPIEIHLPNIEKTTTTKSNTFHGCLK